MEERFDAMVNKTNTCWLWTKSTSKDGYGRFRLPNKHIYAHRFAYERYKGKIPDGLLVRHSCNNPSCVNPNHLKLGTHQDNMNDMKQSNRQAHNSNTKNGNHKLTNDDIIEIRIRRDFGETLKDIANKFNVSFQHISDICKNRYRIM